MAAIQSSKAYFMIQNKLQIKLSHSCKSFEEEKKRRHSLNTLKYLVFVTSTFLHIVAWLNVRHNSYLIPHRGVTYAQILHGYIQIMSSFFNPPGIYQDLSLRWDSTVMFYFPYPTCFVGISKITNYCLTFKRREFLLNGI